VVHVGNNGDVANTRIQIENSSGINALQLRKRVPQGLKPAFFAGSERHG
jgi:hypothetical protein